MDIFWRIAALAVVGAILALALGKQTREMSILLVIACSITIVIFAVSFLEPVVDFVVELRLLGELSEDHVSILLKSAGMCLVLEFVCGICEDSGQAALAKMVRICGNAALIYIALPLLQAVVALLQELLGG